MARKAYVEAMTSFKQNPPDIVKDSQVSYSARGGITAYNHASLANVTKTINSALSIHGLSAAWKNNRSDATTISGVGIKIGDQVAFRLFRDPTDIQDTYPDDVCVITFGIHYQIDTLWSRNITTK